MPLHSHYREYRLSKYDAAESLCTGFSGLPYATRHWDLSKEVYKKKQIWGHRTIAMIEAIPAVGGLAALIERVVVFVCEKKLNIQQDTHASNIEEHKHSQEPHDSLKTLVKKNPNPPSIPRNIKKIRKLRETSKLAILEHIAKARIIHKPCFITLQEGLPSTKDLMIPPATKPLHFTHEIVESQGPRPYMEDAHFYIEDDDKILTGVFDGHGGHEVAFYAKEVCEKAAIDLLGQFFFDIPLALTLLLKTIHKEVKRNPKLDGIGSTAVICHINKLTNEIITAILGDSEANIYRYYEREGVNQLKSIPLSRVLDWGSKQEAKRASKAMNEPEIAKTWPKTKNTKSLRYLNQINVSRALGDQKYAGTAEKPGVIHTAEIGINRLKSGDILILASDGLKDYFSELDIINFLKEHPFNQANEMLELVNWRTHDNVTIILITIT